MPRAKRIQDLHPKKRSAFFAKLEQYGVGPREVLNVIDAGDTAMKDWVAKWPQPARVYDAVTLFGFGSEAAEALPEAREGEVIIHYGGWSLQELRDNKFIREQDLMWVQDWYNRYGWSTEKLPSGIYRVRLPIPKSNRTDLTGQKKLLLPGENPAHIVLEATAWVAHKLKTGQDLLNGDFIRSEHETESGSRAVLLSHDSRLNVYDFLDDDANGRVWFGGAARLAS